MTVERLRELIDELDQKIQDLSLSLDEQDAAENALNVAKSKVKKLTMLRDAVKEKIMAEKILIKEIK
jgi:hypothetical protein